jgi:ABC-type transporter MlaC component
MALNHNREFAMKKISTAFAVALGAAALAACNQSPQEQAADNIEANAENVADTIEANAENVTDTMQANAENAADTVRAEGENTADAVREGADADGNSTN